MNTFLEQNNVNQQLCSDFSFAIIRIYKHVIISPLQQLAKVG